MRKLVLLAVAGAALVPTGGSLPAASVTKTVKITSTAFSPATVTVATGDAVKWSNKDTTAHQVVANARALAALLAAEGLVVTTGGTDTHLITADPAPLGVDGPSRRNLLRRRHLHDRRPFGRIAVHRRAVDIALRSEELSVRDCGHGGGTVRSRDQ